MIRLILFTLLIIIIGLVLQAVEMANNLRLDSLI